VRGDGLNAAHAFNHRRIYSSRSSACWTRGHRAPTLRMHPSP